MLIKENEVKNKMEKIVVLIIAFLILIIIALIGLKTDNTKRISIDSEPIKTRIEKIGGFEILGEKLKPKRFWKITPEWEAYQLIRKNYQGLPVEIKKNLKILFDWSMIEIEIGEQMIKLLKRALIGTKKKLTRRLWERIRKRN